MTAYGCQRTIAKAAYLLLEKYHRLYGLKAHPWSKQPGNTYITFYLDLHTPEGQSQYLLDRYEDHLVLTTYQDHVGIPAWDAGDQLEMVRWQKARTTGVLDWLEDNLTINALFRAYGPEIERWRSRYTVEQSEQYLLSWHVAGLLAARTQSFIQTPYSYFSDYDSQFVEKTHRYTASFTECLPEYGVLSLSDISISERGEAYIGETEKVNIWQRYAQGDSPEGIARDLHARIERLHANEHGIAIKGKT